MERKRVVLEIELDLDPVPGAFHTIESAQEQVDFVVRGMISHYNPQVRITKDIKRVGKNELKTVSKEGRKCEVCNRIVADHTWADMDFHGFIVDCNFNAPKEKSNG